MKMNRESVIVNGLKIGCMCFVVFATLGVWLIMPDEAKGSFVGIQPVLLANQEGLNVDHYHLDANGEIYEEPNAGPAKFYAPTGEEISLELFEEIAEAQRYIDANPQVMSVACGIIPDPFDTFAFDTGWTFMDQICYGPSGPNCVECTGFCSAEVIAGNNKCTRRYNLCKDHPTHPWDVGDLARCKDGVRTKACSCGCYCAS
jgi:hypothetical protein